MPKLNLKRTPEEETTRQRRKQKKKEEKRRKRNESADSIDGSRKRHRTNGTDEFLPKWSSSDDDIGGDSESQPGPSSPRASQSSLKPDYDKIRAELEEQRFREKMFGAFEDDERLDSLEARLNDFAHVPGRWRPGGGGQPGNAVFDEQRVDDFLNVDPRYMDDEAYAEWIRVGMYRFVTANWRVEEGL
jgi:hypothetical protein